VEDQVFGQRYRVTEKIGSGGMADVYKAVDQVLGRTVAVKVLHPRYATDQTFIARFRQEAQAAANLSNPHIVNIYDWGQEDSTYYIVMEYVRGTDLKTLVDEKGPVDPGKAAEYGAQVCAALAVAHSYDVIHRDIKPHNIVLTPDGNVKVMDFGIARAGNTTMTQTGSVLGTAQYISPEQAQGRPLGPASDLYSLGVVLYELTTGRLPFEGETPVAVALKQVNEAPRPPRQINPAIPPALEAVILRAMAKDPAKRYTSAEEMRDDLRRVIAGQPVAAVPVHDETSVMPVVPVGTEHRTAVRRTPVEPPRRSPWGWIAALIALTLLGGILAYASGLFQQNVTVPDVTNMTVPDATALLAKDGLKPGKVAQENNPTVKEGIVFGQSPPKNVQVKKGTTVDLVVSIGPARATVPDLSGMTMNDAIQEIQNAGLRYGGSSGSYSDQPKGTVIGQTPNANAKVDPNTAVSFTLSLGLEQATVPDVVGKSEADAVDQLKAAGFKVTTTREYSSQASEGVVISTNPSANSQVRKGARIAVTVSRGVQLFKVPTVVDMTQAEAEKKLGDAGFIVNVQNVSAPTPQQQGVVVDQNPSGGSAQPKGTAVTIFVGATTTPGP
jgi:serine/threonine-protein kinase